MRLSRVRRAAAFAVGVASLVASPATARAGQRYSAEDLLLVGSALPEGWTFDRTGGATTGETALKEAIVAAAKDTGVAEKLTVFLRTLAVSGGATSVLALINAEEKAEAVLAALEAAGGAKEWTVRELGDPTVIAVVTGPPETRAAAVDLQVAHAVKVLATRAERALEVGNRERAVALAKSIEEMAPKSAVVAYLNGLVAWVDASQAKGADATKRMKEAAALFQQAVSKEATQPLKGAHRARAFGFRGDALLQAAGTEPSAEARDALKEAVAASDDPDISRTRRLGWRYNLACAHARLKEADEAFKHLTAVLEEHAKAPVDGIGHWKDDDPDFANLKTDPRWAALVKKHGADAGGTSGG